MKKRWLIVLGIIVILSGCSQLTEKFHFSSDGEARDTQEDKQEKSNEQQKKSQEDDALTLSSEYFNEIKEVDGRKVIQNPENILALMNKEYALPDDYVPDDLVRPNVNFSFGDQDIEKSYLRKEAAEALEEMFAQAEKEGIELFAVSGYRSYDRQKVLYDAEVAKVGEEKAIEAVAYPGNSEHQSGLSLDISSRSVNLELTQQFGETKEGKWLKENAHKFGFILRYPKEKEDITGYKYEPWHFRYVGKEAAKVIYENQLTLEEYFDLVKKI